MRRTNSLIAVAHASAGAATVGLNVAGSMRNRAHLMKSGRRCGYDDAWNATVGGQGLEPGQSKPSTAPYDSCAMGKVCRRQARGWPRLSDRLWSRSAWDRRDGRSESRCPSMIAEVHRDQGPEGAASYSRDRVTLRLPPESRRSSSSWRQHRPPSRPAASSRGVQRPQPVFNPQPRAISPAARSRHRSLDPFSTPHVTMTSGATRPMARM
jgi:hypothetical protein